VDTSKDVQIRDLNLGIVIKPQLVKFNANLDLSTATTKESLFKEYKDVLACSYKDFKLIPPHIDQHWKKLDTMIPPFH